MKRYDQQVRLSFQANTDDPLSFDFFTANVAEGFNSGIETSIQYRLNNNLILNMNTGLLKNYVNSYTNPIDPSHIYGDREPAHSPAFSYSFIINYFLGEKIHFSIENSGMDDFYFEDQYYPKSQYYNIFNSSISLKHNKWDFTVWGKNILDEKYATKGYYFDLGIGEAGDKSYKMYGKPAHYGLTVQYIF
jgi:outer membrane receptor protein involved in Fe transport